MVGSTPDLGPCCACLGFELVRTVFHLPFKAPIPGTGWSCDECGLPPDGAKAVLCDRCIVRGTPNVLFVCRGLVSTHGRVPAGHVAKMPFGHLANCLADLRPRACRVCGCTAEYACVDPIFGPSFWTEPDLCSVCAAVKRITPISTSPR